MPTVQHKWTSNNYRQKRTAGEKKHQEKDPSEGGTGNVPDIPDGMLFQCDCIVTVH